MKRTLMGLGLGTVLLLNGMMSGTAAQPVVSDALLEECGLRYVDEGRIQTAALSVGRDMRLFSMTRYLCAATLAGLGGYNAYSWYNDSSTRATNVRLDTLETAVFKGERGVVALEKNPAIAAVASKTWGDSFRSFGKGVFTGLPTAIMSTIASGALLGLTTSVIPIPELLKAEPSFNWFLMHRTSFAQECTTLAVYYQQQAIHDAFCTETVCLVGDVEKIIGYIDYHIARVKKSSSVVAKVLGSRRAQLIDMTRQLVDNVAQKKYDAMLESLQLLSSFVGTGLTAGVIQ